MWKRPSRSTAQTTTRTHPCRHSLSSWALSLTRFGSLGCHCAYLYLWKHASKRRRVNSWYNSQTDSLTCTCSSFSSDCDVNFIACDPLLPAWRRDLPRRWMRPFSRRQLALAQPSPKQWILELEKSPHQQNILFRKPHIDFLARGRLLSRALLLAGNAIVLHPTQHVALFSWTGSRCT